MTDARLAAARVLMNLEGGRTTLAAETERARQPLAEARDRALLLELVAGTLRWLRELDVVVAAAARRGVGGLDAPVRAVLRLGAYQLLHLQRVPPHAVVHESVEVVRAAGQPKAAGLVNAVLRTIARDHTRGRLPARPAGDADRQSQLAYLGTTLSHPDWLIARWLDRYGFDATEQWCLFNNAPPEITVRSRTGEQRDALLALLVQAGADATPAPFAPDAIRLPAGSFGRLPFRMRERLLIQDEGSQLVAWTVQAAPGARVLDVCAAPGGKTVLLAGAMSGRGTLVAGDLRESRLRLLAGMLARTKTRASVIALDATRSLPFTAQFDRVLLDAPCSGLGTLRRDPDLKWSRRPDDLPVYARAQREMLRHAADVVAPDGAIVYATCSSEPEENAAVVDGFLGSDPRFALEPALPPDFPRAAALLDARGCLVTMPFRHGLDAFFAARLVRRRAA
jgi:16S rRNA (cytosine967-C5)-methyltransferase